MKSNRIMFALVVIVVFSIIGAGISIIFTKFIKFSTSNSFETSAPKTKPLTTILFNPPLPQHAPEEIKDAVLLGYNIMTDTRKYATGYVGGTIYLGNSWDWVIALPVSEVNPNYHP